MKATLEQQGDLFICHLAGRMDYHSVDPFKDTCLKNLSDKKVIFDLRELSFVGSVGIGSFLETVSALSQSPNGQVKFCGVQTEFRRIFEASDVKHIEIYDDEQRARLAFQGYAVTPVNYNFLNRLFRDQAEEIRQATMVESQSVEATTPVTTTVAEVSESVVEGAINSEIEIKE